MNTITQFRHPAWIRSGKHALAVLTLLLPLISRGGGVVTECTETNLRSALTGGGTVTFACDGTIALSNTIAINTNTVLDGGGHRITISGNNSVRVFYVNTNVHLTLSNLTIANGFGDNGAGIYNAGGQLGVQDCVFTSNNAIGQTGGIGVPGTNGCGGALFNNGVATIANSTFAMNAAVGGAGGKGFNGNRVPGGPGGLGYGGAIHNSGEVSLTQCTLVGNNATGGAGGTGAKGGTGGAGGAGGASYGGSLFNAGVARLANTTLTGNASTGGSGGGGGAGGGDGYYPPHYGRDGGNGNAGGSGSGGGIHDLTGQCYMTNCTVAFNRAVAGGGGVGGQGGYGQFGNGAPGLPGPAGSAGGGGITGGGGAFLINVLLDSNAPNNGNGNLLDGGHNLSSDGSCAFANVGSQNNSDALTGPLMDNGGATRTMALMPGSPAIDTGDNGATPPTDQRGVLRPVGPASDIGAYECRTPAIMADPQSQSAVFGTTVEFSAPTAGYPPLGYQWYLNGAYAIAGATSHWLRLTNIQFFQGGAYTLVVTNAFGATTSSPAILGVFQPTVTNCTETALRAAMARGGTVTFAGDGIIELASTITNEIDTVLDGTGRQIIISGNRACRSFFVKSNVNFTVLNLTIANGRSDQGAGIYNAGGCVTVRNCRFAGNSATGSAAAYYSGDPGSDGCGGAVYNSGSLNAINCAFLSNSVVGGAGAKSTSPSVPGGAGGDGNGGAIGNSGILIMTGCWLANNSASGGVGGDGGAAAYSPFPNPGGPGGAGGDGKGGALFNDGSAFLVNNTFALNAGAGGQGGSGGSGSPPMTESSWSGDGGHGGIGGSGYSAIYDGSGKCHLTNCTVTSNPTTRGTGGPGGPPGGWPYPYPPREGQPGANGSNGTPGSGLKATGTHLVNTLLSSNTPGNCIGTITDAGHNLSSDDSCAFTTVGSLNNTEPKLGPLADNGGPTPTLALLPGSPAIDAGDNTAAPPTDQRGIPRPFGAAADIGAYEYAPRLRISRSTGNGLRILLRDGNPGQTCRLLASTSVSNWVCVATNQIGPDGTAQFQDECDAGELGRFYKVALP